MGIEFSEAFVDNFLLLRYGLAGHCFEGVVNIIKMGFGECMEAVAIVNEIIRPVA